MAYHDTTVGNLGGQYRANEDVDIVSGVDGSATAYAVNHFETGEWLAYTIEVTETREYDVALRVVSAFANEQVPSRDARRQPRRWSCRPSDHAFVPCRDSKREAKLTG